MSGPYPQEETALKGMIFTTPNDPKIADKDQDILTSTEQRSGATGLETLPLALPQLDGYVPTCFRWGIGDDLVHERFHFWDRADRLNTIVPTSVDKAQEYYLSFEAIWLGSKSYEALEAFLINQLSVCGKTIKKAIIFGSDSLATFTLTGTHNSRSPWIQIAVLRTVANLVEKISGRRPQCYAQEPFYHEFDIRLLTSLGFSEIIHPRGFDLIDEETFVYSPYVPFWVERQIMHHDPGLFLHREMTRYRPDSPEVECIRRGVPIPFDIAEIYIGGILPWGRSPWDGWNDPALNLLAKLKRQIEIGVRVTMAFQETYDSFALPPLFDPANGESLGFGFEENETRLYAKKDCFKGCKLSQGYPVYLSNVSEDIEMTDSDSTEPESSECDKGDDTSSTRLITDSEGDVVMRD